MEPSLDNSTPSSNAKPPAKVASAPGPRFIFLYGPTGSGKTRLVESYLKYHKRSFIKLDTNWFRYDKETDVICERTAKAPITLSYDPKGNMIHYRASIKIPETVQRVWVIASVFNFRSFKASDFAPRDWSTPGSSVELFQVDFDIWNHGKQRYNFDKLPWDVKKSPDTLWPVIVTHVDLETMFKACEDEQEKFVDTM